MKNIHMRSWQSHWINYLDMWQNLNTSSWDTEHLRRNHQALEKAVAFSPRDSITVFSSYSTSSYFWNPSIDRHSGSLNWPTAIQIFSDFSFRIKATLTATRICRNFLRNFQAYVLPKNVPPKKFQPNFWTQIL